MLYSMLLSAGESKIAAIHHDNRYDDKRIKVAYIPIACIVAFCCCICIICICINVLLSIPDGDGIDTGGGDVGLDSVVCTFTVTAGLVAAGAEYCGGIGVQFTSIF